MPCLVRRQARASPGYQVGRARRLANDSTVMGGQHDGCVYELPQDGVGHTKDRHLPCTRSRQAVSTRAKLSSGTESARKLNAPHTVLFWMLNPDFRPCLQHHQLTLTHSP